MASTDEPASVGDDGAGLGQGGVGLQALDETGDPGEREPEEPDVVLAEIRPLGIRIGEGMQHAGTEPCGRPEVLRQPHHLHGGLELGIVESPAAVDDDHDPFRREPLVLQKAAHDVPGEVGPAVGQHHRRHAQGIEVPGFLRHGQEP